MAGLSAVVASDGCAVSRVTLFLWAGFSDVAHLIAIVALRDTT